MNFKYILTGFLTIGVLMSVQESRAIAQISQPEPQVLLARNPNESSSWVRFTSRQRGFTVAMPGNYKIDDGKTWTIGGTDSDTLYRVSYFDTNAATESNIDKFVNNYFKSAPDFKEIYRSPLTIRGYPGRESSFRFSDGNGRLRLFAVRNRIYMVRVINRGANEKKIASFLDSFGLF